MKECIKESAFERRQELPAGAGAAPLCQPLKYGADYRDVTATLKMKHLRRLCGERRTFSAVAAPLCRRRRREHGICRTLSLSPHRKTLCTTANITRYGVWVSPMNKIFSKCHPPHDILFPFFYFEEIKERPSQGCAGASPRKLRRLRWFLRKVKHYHIF